MLHEPRICIHGPTASRVARAAASWMERPLFPERAFTTLSWPQSCLSHSVGQSFFQMGPSHALQNCPKGIQPQNVADFTLYISGLNILRIKKLP